MVMITISSLQCSRHKVIEKFIYFLTLYIKFIKINKTIYCFLRNKTVSSREITLKIILKIKISLIERRLF